MRNSPSQSLDIDHRTQVIQTAESLYRLCLDILNKHRQSGFPTNEYIGWISETESNLRNLLGHSGFNNYSHEIDYSIKQPPALEDKVLKLIMELEPLDQSYSNYKIYLRLLYGKLCGES